MKHKHAEVLHAFVDGIECEWFDSLNNKWHLIRELKEFDWVDTVRIKPEPKPDNVAYSIVYKYEDGCAFVTHAMKNKSESYNLKLTFDGETCDLKNAEVIK